MKRCFVGDCAFFFFCEDSNVCSYLCMSVCIYIYVYVCVFQIVYKSVGFMVGFGNDTIVWIKKTQLMWKKHNILY